MSDAPQHHRRVWRFNTNATRGWNLDKKVRFHTQMKGPDECWLWNGPLDTEGYGNVRVAGKLLRAHRAAWTVWRGSIPHGLWVLHRCDNPPCCNPNHLFLGTVDDNNKDKASKGRAKGPPRGEEHHAAKLTWKQAEEIRTSEGPLRIQAKRHSVSPSRVSEIRRGIAWRT